jgi:uncharacterized protein YdeI (YjbR/CyaY-like superfamily)
MAPTFFATQSAFRTWLEKHHNTETELVVGFYKVGSHKPSITWSQSVDQALCFGWIDGVRKSVDGMKVIAFVLLLEKVLVFGVLSILKK